MAIDDIPFALPSLGPEEEAAVIRVLRSRWLTTGREALAFEKEFAAYLENSAIKGADSNGTPNTGGTNTIGEARALALNSATGGLHLALEALGIGPGDVVLVPSYTFTASAEVVRYLGAEPVLVDSIPGAFNIDPEQLEQSIARLEKGLPAYERPGKAAGSTGARSGFGPRGKPRAIIPVHYGGLPCDMEAILAIARKHGLTVVEDAAHAFPALLPDGSVAGTLGDAGVFSFYATKTITTGEGGMVFTRNEALAKRIAVMRSHGIDRSVWNRYTDAASSWYYEVVEPGFKYNLPDILAAIGRVQLGRAASMLEQRRAIAASYDRAFAGGPFIIPPSSKGDVRHLYPLRLQLDKISINRDTFIERLKEKGIGASVHYVPLHLMPYYAKRQGLAPDDFPEALKNYTECLSLPLWPDMGEARVNRVISAVLETAGTGQP
ncbi:MAG: DegT/DnrJ/EryC1/StrS family aminotransferase [Spirochaetaceae bacterium]|nr:DegT/DnrJ/EryC1/StrS family aminotransferase [Spirochaetaceae bacterium]